MTRAALLDALRSEAHVWLADPDADAHLTASTDNESLLGKTERACYRRFHFEKDRRLYLVAHTLLRTSLSRYADLAPSEWVFDTNPHGRPEIATELPVPPLRFNLAHTRGLVACSVGLVDAGIDVERTRQLSDLLALAKRNFSSQEYEALLGLPEQDRPERFFAYWTLKEAYVKAKGMGLSLPLDRFSFELDSTPPLGIAAPRSHRIAIRFANSLDDNADDWQFLLCRPTEEHHLAVALRCGRGKTLAVVQRWATAPW
ncbi:MAG: 4'-phosphopantetheinyl transferase superfamily protein [Pseudomonadota bacterium]